MSFKEFLNEARGYNLEVVVSKAGEVQEFLKSDFRGLQKQEDTNAWIFKKEDDLFDAVVSMVDADIISKDDILNTDIDLDEIE